MTMNLYKCRYPSGSIDIYPKLCNLFDSVAENAIGTCFVPGTVRLIMSEETESSKRKKAKGYKTINSRDFSSYHLNTSRSHRSLRICDRTGTSIFRELWSIAHQFVL